MTNKKTVIASEARQSTSYAQAALDCFARARNDGYFIILFLLLTACTADRPEIATYTVNMVKVEPAKCTVKVNLQITEPVVGPGLDSSRIAIMENAQRINYYSGVKWAAPVSEMMQSVLVDSFTKTGAFANISTEAQAVQNDMILMSEIRNFEITDQQSGKIHLRMISKLVNSKDRKVLATIPVEKEITPTSLSMENIIAAFNEASATAASEIATGSIAALPHCKPVK